MRNHRFQRNPRIHIEGDAVYADQKLIGNSWEELFDENVLVVGPFPTLFHPPGTYILYLLQDSKDKELYIGMVRGNTSKCKKCVYQKEMQDPCCQEATYEFDWFDGQGDYIGPEEYDPDTGWEDFPECQCECQCLAPPIFHMRKPIGGPGTLEMFWGNYSSRFLIGAVQFIVDEDDNNLLITHMVVRKDYQRNKINSFMINEIRKRHPTRELLFYELTNQGRRFMESYGGSEFDPK